MLLNEGNRIIKIMKIKKNKENEVQFEGQEIRNEGDFYEIPIRSSLLNIFKGKMEIVGEPFNIRSDDIKFKLMAVPDSNNDWVFVPIKKFYSNSCMS